MRSRQGWTVVMLAIVATGISAVQRNDSTAVLKGSAAFGPAAPVFNGLFEASIRRRDHSHIDVPGL